MKAVNPENRSIILASGSPRRRELTRRIGFEPIVEVSSILEVHEPSESPIQYARRLAVEKARDVASSLRETPPRWILSADTIVVHDGDILEKPADSDDAKAMLRRLSDDEHEVITAFCWTWPSASGEDDGPLEVVRDVSARVWLRRLDDEMIARYVATGEPMDKAGSYGIQDVGAVLVRRLQGSYFAVVGLPVCEVVETLQQLGGLESYPFDDKN